MTSKKENKKKNLWSKNIFWVVSILIVSIVVFYFWGSSSNVNKEEYASIYTFEYEEEKVEVDSFRIVSYNMGYLSGMTNNKAVDRNVILFDTNLLRINELLKSLKVDVVCLQEIDFHSKRSFKIDQLDELAESGKYPHASRVINWDKKYVPFPYWPPTLQFGEVLSGQAVLSNFPIVDNERIVLSKADYAFYYNAFYLDRLAQLNVVSIGEREVIIINVHLEAWDARARERQAEQLIELYKKYEKDYPVLLVGDFNSTPPGAKDPYMEEKTIENLLAVEGVKMAISKDNYLENEKKHFTFNSKEPYIKIDYIFYNSDKLSLSNARVVVEANDISDHLPIIADVKFID